MGIPPGNWGRDVRYWIRGANPCWAGLYIGKWLNLVEHLVWDQGVAGSNLVFPTIWVGSEAAKRGRL